MSHARDFETALSPEKYFNFLGLDHSCMSLTSASLASASFERV